MFKYVWLIMLSIAYIIEWIFIIREFINIAKRKGYKRNIRVFINLLCNGALSASICVFVTIHMVAIVVLILILFIYK